MPVDRRPIRATRWLLGFALALAVALALTVALTAPGDAQARDGIATLAGSPGGKVSHARAVARAGCARQAARRNLSARQRRAILRRSKRCKTSRPGATGPMYWGAWVGNQLTGTEAPWDMNAVAKFEGMAGKHASVINFSSPFADCSKSPCSFYDFPAAEMERIRDHGSIPFFSWASQSTPAKLDQPNFQLADVIAGTYDGYIREWAEAARDWGHPFFLRFNWEMNGGWFAWQEGVNGNQPGESVAAWRHVHDIFTSVGATNATWVWCPNVDPFGKLTDLASLYPGDAYVDWTGLDGYNWGTNPASPKGWMSFDELFEATYDEIVEGIAPSKPMIIGETGSTESGGDKAAWIADALRSARTEYPQLRGLLWFEKYDDGMDWPIETSSAAARAFAAGIQDPSYVGAPVAAATAGTIQPAG
jgi:beta-mannanase